MSEHTPSTATEPTGSGLQVPITRRRVLLSAAYGGLAAFLAACTGTTASPTALPSAPPLSPGLSPSPAPSPSLKSVDMKILMLNAQKLPDFWKGLADLWNKTQTKFRINLDITTEADPDVTLNYRTVLSGQTPPDMIFVFGGRRYMDVADAGLVVDLTPYADQYGWKDRLVPGFYDGLTHNGKLYEIGYGSIPHPYIWYNRQIFQQLGITIPDDRLVTQDKMLEIVTTVRDAKLEPIAFGNKQKSLGGHYAWINFQRLMNNDYLEQLRLSYTQPVDVKFTDQGPISAAKATQDGAQAGMFSNGFNALEESDAIALFAQKKAAMTHAGYWGVLTLPTNAPDIDIDFFQYPVLDPSIPVSIIDFAGFASMVSSKSKIPDEMAAFLDFVISDQGQKLFFEGNYGPPVTPLPADVKLPHPLWAELLKVSAAVQHHPFQLEVDAPGPVADKAKSDLQSLLDGRMTPEEWCSNVQKNIDADRP